MSEWQALSLDITGAIGTYYRYLIKEWDVDFTDSDVRKGVDFWNNQLKFHIPYKENDLCEM